MFTGLWCTPGLQFMAACQPHGVKRVLESLVSESIPSICRDSLSTELSRNRICERDGQQNQGGGWLPKGCEGNREQGGHSRDICQGGAGLDAV